MDKALRSKLPLALLLGMVAGLGVAILVAMVGSWLIAGEKIPEAAMDWIAMVALLCGSAVAAKVTAGKADGMRPLLCIAGSGIYFVGLCCVAAVFFEGVNSGVGVSMLLTLCGALAIWLIGLRGSKKPKYRSAKYRF